MKCVPNNVTRTGNDNSMIFHQVLGEANENIIIIISVVIFPLLSQKTNKSRIESIYTTITVISTSSMSMLLYILQWNISSGTFHLEHFISIIMIYEMFHCTQK
jgi:hypothetical protein